MPPALAARDTQATWKPTWLFHCAALPHSYAIRDISIPAVPGDPFTTGDSETGGTDTVGGGSGPDALHAWGRIVGWPTVTRRITDPFWPLVEQSAIRLTIAERLTGDYAAEPFTLSRYDAASGVLLYELSGVITHTSVEREGTEITGVSLDTAILEEPIPKGTVTSEAFPLAPDIGRGIAWLFGNTVNLPLPCVRDDQITSQFDYLLCRDTAAALLGVRRVTPGSPTPFIELTTDELEPYPGMDGVLVNGGMEDWDVTTAPDGWVLVGAGGTVVKNTTAGQFDEGSASASLTRAGTNTRLQQDLLANTPTLPLSWWQGREITLTARVRATVATRAYLRINDSVGASDSATHTGGGAFETLSVTRTINAAATTLTIQGRIDFGDTTAQFDDVRVYLRAKSWNECLRPDLYPGYTAIRTFLRQEDSGGSLFTLAADVHGLQPERNLVRAARTILTHATHGLGRTVDAGSFDAREIEASFTYDEAVRLHGPSVYLSMQDPIENTQTNTPPITVGTQSFATGLARDRSGYERHAQAHISPPSYLTSSGGPSGAQNEAYIDEADGAAGNVSYFVVPYDVRPGYLSPDGHTFELWYYIDSAAVNGAATMLMELRRPVTSPELGHYLKHASSQLTFGVSADVSGAFSVSFTLTAGVHTQRWMHVVARAGANVLSILIDGVVVATGSYTGVLDTQYTTGLDPGPWDLFLYSTFGGPAVQPNWWTRAAMYPTALSDARVAAHVAAITTGLDPISTYDVQAQDILAPTFSYACAENLGETLLRDDTLAHDGAWVGGPLLGPGVPGPLPTEFYVFGSTAARFQNNVAQYGVETGMTLADAARSIIVWYKPTTLKATAGIVEKTIGGVRDTQWGLCQRPGTGPNGVIRLTYVDAGGVQTLDTTLLPEDVGRWTWLVATFSAGVVRLWKNRGRVTGAYTAPLASGVGDFYIGVQGTNGAGRTRPAQGDIGRVSYYQSALSIATVDALWLAGTWYNGGLCVDWALTDAQQAQDALAAIGQLRGLRLGFTATGTITCTVDATTPAQILIDARDGAGDGERNIVAIGHRERPALEDRVRDVVVQYRRDELTGAYLGEIRREVSTKTDANGKRIGRDRTFTLPGVREHPTADRFADYARQRFVAAQVGATAGKVEVTLHQEARRLMEGDLIQVTDALLDYASEVMEVIEVRKSLDTIRGVVQTWPADLQTYVPAAFPPGATSG